MPALGVSPGERGVCACAGSSDTDTAAHTGLDYVERHDPNRRGWCVLGDHRVMGFDVLQDSGE